MMGTKTGGWRALVLLAALLALPAAADIRESGGAGAGDGGTASNAALQPWHLSAVGSMLYLSAPRQSVVRRILPDGTIELVAGTYVPRSGNDPLPAPGVLLPATGARLSQPTALAADIGDVYVSSGRSILVVQGGAIRVVVASGISDSIGGMTIAGDWLYVAADGGVRRYPLPCGLICDAPTVLATGLSVPTALTVAPDGSVYVAESGSGRVKRIPPGGGTPEVVAGGGPTLGDGALATSANLANPSGVAFDAATGDLYISDAGHFRVRRVRGGVITTVAGTGTANRVSDWVEPGQVGGDPTRQPLTPAGLAIVGQSLWVAADARLYALDLSAALPTITVALPTATSTATAPLPTSTATARPTLVPTSTHTSVPTATATIRACDVGEAPSCVMSRIF